MNRGTRIGTVLVALLVVAASSVAVMATPAMLGATTDERITSNGGAADVQATNGSDNATASVTFANQTTNGSAVTVASVTVPEGGFVTIHDSSLLPPENATLLSVIGVSEYLSPGTHENVTIEVYERYGGESTQGPVRPDDRVGRLTANQSLIAMPHRDTNGNGEYDFVASDGETDGPYVVNSSAVTDDAAVTVPQSSRPNATVAFDDQATDGTTVTIDSVTTTDDGFVAIHDTSLLSGNIVGSVVGVSEYLEAGSHENVTVELFAVPGANASRSELGGNATLIAMPHLDTNGNQTYDFVRTDAELDGPYTANETTIIDRANVTVEGGETPEDEMGAPPDDGEAALVCEAGSTAEVLGENDEDDDGDGAIDEDDEDINDGPSNDDDDGDGAIDEDDECDDGDDGSDDLGGNAEDDDDGDGHFDEDDEADGGNSNDIDDDGDGAVDEDDEPDDGVEAGGVDDSDNGDDGEEGDGGDDGAGDDGAENETTLTILSYNDIQTAAARNQNLPRLVELIAERRQAHDNPTVVAGGGDEIAPHALGPLSQWRAPVDVLNLVGPDAEGVGNHDLDYGLSSFANASDASEFPWLATNLVNATTGEPITGAESYEIVEKGGVRVGFIGLVDAAIKNKTNLAFGGNASRLEDFREVGPETATMLKEEKNVDVVVALAHIGVPESKELARADDGAIDAIVTGDDEIYYPPQKTSGTVITEASASAAYLGELNLTVEGGEVTGSNGRIINVTNATPKNDTASAIITEYRAEASFDQTVAVSEVALDARRPFPTAVRETAYGHLITDAMRNETGADVAIIQEGGIRSDGVYGPGNISGSDVFSTLPFGNTLVTLEVTGEELETALASQIRSDRPEEGVAQQVSGISFEWTDDPDAEEKVQNVTVGGEPLDPNATYTLTVSNFVAEGGDGYPLADEPRINVTDKLLAITVIEYMEALGTVSPSAEGRTEEIGVDDGNASSIGMPSGIRAVAT